MPRKTKTKTKRPKTKGNALPKSQVKPEKQMRATPQPNSYNTYAPYQNVPTYYSQFGANTWA